MNCRTSQLSLCRWISHIHKCRISNRFSMDALAHAPRFAFGKAAAFRRFAKKIARVRNSESFSFLRSAALVKVPQKPSYQKPRAEIRSRRFCTLCERLTPRKCVSCATRRAAAAYAAAAAPQKSAEALRFGTFRVFYFLPECFSASAGICKTNVITSAITAIIGFTEASPAAVLT